MKTPNVCSVPIPHLLDVDPMAPFEFHFPTTTDDFWWDDMDTLGSDYDCSDTQFSDCDCEPDADLDLSFNSTFYHISNIPTSMSTKEEGKICRRSPQEDDIVPKLISTIAKAAPTNVYKRQKLSMKRKRSRKKRKKMIVSNVEPEFRTLWLNFVDVLPAMDPVLPSPTPTTLPTINLTTVNKQMLRRLPDVKAFPILSCSNDPDFYTKPIQYKRDSSITGTQFEHPQGYPFGYLSAIMTDLGPVPPPSSATFGYVWTEAGWRVKAEVPLPQRDDPGGGRLHGQGRGGRGEG